MEIISIILTMIFMITLAWTIYHIPILISGIAKKKSYKESASPSKENCKNFPKFSIIVPAKNEEPVIARCMESILKQEYPKDKIEILVIEGGSEDNTRALCEEYSKRHPATIKLLSQRTSNGKPSALNEALKYATGEIVAIFDADNVLERDVLKKAAIDFQDDSTVALQGRTSSINEDENYLTKIVAKEEKAWFGALIQGRHNLNLFVPLTGSCQFVRRKTLLKHEGWREDSLAEDIDLALKLAEEDHKIQYDNDVRSWQETPSSLKSLVTQRTRWYMGYMENLIHYGRLLKKPSLRLIDGEMTLLGPCVMVLCGMSYLIWFLKLLLSAQDVYIGFVTYGLSVVMTALTLFSIGAALLFMDKPFKIKKLLWIPFIYFYWAVETFIAVWAFIQTILPRKKKWRKTEKNGTVTNHSVIQGYKA